MESETKALQQNDHDHQEEDDEDDDEEAEKSTTISPSLNNSSKPEEYSEEEREERDDSGEEEDSADPAADGALPRVITMFIMSLGRSEKFCCNSADNESTIAAAEGVSAPERVKRDERDGVV